jgi:hypothetical protein
MPHPLRDGWGEIEGGCAGIPQEVRDNDTFARHVTNLDGMGTCLVRPQCCTSHTLCVFHTLSTHSTQR